MSLAGLGLGEASVSSMNRQSARTWLVAALIVLTGLVVLEAPAGAASATPAGSTADLAVELTAQAVSGRPLYTVTVTNNGPDMLQSAVIRTGRFNAESGAGWTQGSCRYDGIQYVDCTFGALQPGASAQATFTGPGPISSPLSGPFTVTATRRTSAPADPRVGNDSASATCFVFLGHVFSC
jgi:hypothetical protein